MVLLFDLMVVATIGHLLFVKKLSLGDLEMTFTSELFKIVWQNNDFVWWHISATRYEIAIVIILGNFHDNSKFPRIFI